MSNTLNEGYDQPNYTQIPNRLLEEHMAKMGHAEFKVVMAVARRTFGWHKRSDRISLSQLEDLTGLSRPSVISGVQEAMERGVLERTESGNSYEYRLVFQGGVPVQESTDPDSKDTSPGGKPTSPDQSSNLTNVGKATSPKGVKQVNTQKKGKEKKERGERKRAPAQGDVDPGLQAVGKAEQAFGRMLRPYQRKRIREEIDSQAKLNAWNETVDRLAMQGKTNVKAVQWAMSDYTENLQTERTQERSGNWVVGDWV